MTFIKRFLFRCLILRVYILVVSIVIFRDINWWCSLAHLPLLILRTGVGHTIMHDRTYCSINICSGRWKYAERRIRRALVNRQFVIIEY